MGQEWEGEQKSPGERSVACLELHRHNPVSGKPFAAKFFQMTHWHGCGEQSKQGRSSTILSVLLSVFLFSYRMQEPPAALSTKSPGYEIPSLWSPWLLHFNDEVYASEKPTIFLWAKRRRKRARSAGTLLPELLGHDLDMWPWD